MKLGESQLDEYERSGLLTVTDLFSRQEVEQLRGAFAQDSEIPGPHRIAEDDGHSVRAVYASHLRHPVFEWLVRCERLLGAARQLAGPELYVWQFKINTKRPFGGAAWCWHQDYIVWREFDGLPAPDAVSAAVFLDDVTEFNGPIVFVPQSHRAGVIQPPSKDGDPTSDLHVDPEDFEIANETIADLVARHGIVAPKGGAGSVLFFHPNVVHASGLNISPFRRDLLIVTYNPLRNAPGAGREPRAEYLVGRPDGSLELAETPGSMPA
jgi:ectoine hydroxylase